MNIIRVELNPPGVVARTRAGSAESAIKNVIYWHGFGWRGARKKSGDFRLVCCYEDQASIVRPMLWLPKRTVVELAERTEGHMEVERDVWDNPDAAGLLKGQRYELQSGRHRSGVVVELLDDADYLHGVTSHGSSSPPEGFVKEKLSLAVVYPETLWPYPTDESGTTLRTES